MAEERRGMAGGQVREQQRVGIAQLPELHSEPDAAATPNQTELPAR